MKKTSILCSHVYSLPCHWRLFSNHSRHLNIVSPRWYNTMIGWFCGDSLSGYWRSQFAFRSRSVVPDGRSRCRIPANHPTGRQAAQRRSNTTSNARTKASSKTIGFCHFRREAIGRHTKHGTCGLAQVGPMSSKRCAISGSVTAATSRWEDYPSRQALYDIGC